MRTLNLRGQIMHHRIHVLVFCFFLCGILFSQFLTAQELPEQKTATLFPFHFASTDVEEKKAISELNNLFYDLFAGQFVSTGYFRVVDRQHIRELIDEIKLQQSGLTQNEVIEIGKMQGAELAIFGTVTKVMHQTYLTMKIIDIETTLILKVIKAKGSLTKPDALALEAGLDFMDGLSSVLVERYGLGSKKLSNISKNGLQAYLKGRDSAEQALVAKQDGDEKKGKKLLQEAESHFQKAVLTDPGLESAVAEYKNSHPDLFDLPDQE